jgi:stage II sporulation protein M
VIVGYRNYQIQGDQVPWMFRNLAALRDSMEQKPRGIQIAMLLANNLRVSLFSLLFGWILGIVPMLSVGLNGVLIGVGARLMVARGGWPLGIVIASFIPHGVLELPAFISVQAVGMRLGFLIPLVWRGRATTGDLGRAFAEGVVILLLFAVPALALAAVVELSLTPALIRAMAPGYPAIPY